MALSIFVDALPYNEVAAHYRDRFENTQISELIPNIAYSSSLHWQLYCNQYPDQRGVLVDWVKEPEKRKSVRIISTLLSPLDGCGDLAVAVRKVLDRYVYRRNMFANIPFRFRKEFSQKGQYLFWKENTYRAQSIFEGYAVISQDEGHKSFERTMELLNAAIENGEKNIFAVFGEVDMLGHKCRRGDLYSQRIQPCVENLLDAVDRYRFENPEEEILIVSDHGMSTVKQKVNLGLESRFGRQSGKRYIAYCDSAVMCLFCGDDRLKMEIRDYLAQRQEGHLLTDAERKKFGALDPKFGDLIYILREGHIFADNWFGKSLRRPGTNGSGMHGFWPERCAKDQMACVMLVNGRETLPETCDYPYAHGVIVRVMKGMDRN